MNCWHRQAEPVTLSTGEVVACICIECYQQLSLGYIEDQRKRAEIAANCDHDDWVDITGFGDQYRRYICLYCGTAGIADTSSTPHAVGMPE